MMIQFEKIRGNADHGQASVPAHAPYSTRSNSNVIQLDERAPPLLPTRSHSLGARNESASIHKRSEFTQAFLDAFAILFAFLFVTVTGLGITGAVFMLLFVRL
jgi:hypothetical protein